jgi:fructan beta-fructosidase
MRNIAFLRVVSVLILAVHGVGYSQTYSEALRPQFHFTAEKGWLNDPNGLVYYKGEYHLFFQHNPNGTNWVEGLSWGHAISGDLVHWKQLEDTIPPTPRPDGKWAGSYSGTGFVDWNNSGGFATGEEKPIVLAWTATGFGQCLAYSNDGGKTFTKYAQNPVIEMPVPKKKGDWDRDPDVFWYEPGQHWVLLYSVTGTGFIVNTSTDLKHWERASVIEGFFECPGCFELAVDGNAANKKWVVWDASSKYVIGAFDGRKFTKEAGPFVLDQGKNYYAAQSWSDAPNRRRISVGWMRNSRFPGMPFNQQMGIASELKLKTIPGEGVRLTKFPVDEVKSLREHEEHVENQPLEPGGDLLVNLQGDTFDIETQIDPANATAITLNVRGQALKWSGGKLSIAGASANVPAGPGHPLRLRVLIDRTSIEAYADDGAASLTTAFVPAPKDRSIRLTAVAGQARVISHHVWEMRSAWGDAR